MRITGSGSSKMVQLIREIGKNVEITVELATVTNPPPELKIKIDNMDVELEKEDLVVAEYLTEHKRKVNIETENYEITSENINEEMSEEGDPSHEHDITSLELENGNLKIEEAEIKFLDELEVGDRVIVAGVNHGQLYYIFDRAVTY